MMTERPTVRAVAGRIRSKAGGPGISPSRTVALNAPWMDCLRPRHSGYEYRDNIQRLAKLARVTPKLSICRC